MMIKWFATCLLFFACIVCHAQGLLVFEKIEDASKYKYPLIKTYSLPRAVTCTFKDGRVKDFVLTAIRGDSLIFEQYYNFQNENCTWSSLTKIKIHKPGETYLYTLAGASAIYAAIFIPFTIIGINHQATEVGDPTKAIAILFGVPISIISTTLTVVFINALPKKYKPGEWKMYAQ